MGRPAVHAQEDDAFGAGVEVGVLGRERGEGLGSSVWGLGRGGGLGGAGGKARKSELGKAVGGGFEVGAAGEEHGKVTSDY